MTNVPPLGPDAQRTADDFHRLYYDSETWKDTYWLGVPTLKCPLDMWLYQEVIFSVKPDVIVECGTFMGGSAYFMASVLDLIGNGKVITIDVDPREGRPKHRRIRYIIGSSVDPEVLQEVRSRIRTRDRVIVILDSDHSQKHVAQELSHYAPLVTPGSYLVVEDTNINGHPVYPEFGPGPREALDEFLALHDEFEVDASREKFFVGFNPGGWLKRIR